MGTKATKSNTKSKKKAASKNLYLSNKIKLRYAAPIIAVIVIVGGFFIYRSFAATANPPACAKGTINLGYEIGFKNGSGYKIRLCRISDFPSKGSEDDGSVRVSSTASANWLALYNAAKKAKIPLVADSSFRSHKKQTELYNCYKAGKCNYAAKPGYSNHQSGVAIDIDIVPGPNNDPSLTTCKNNPGKYWVYYWLSKNASKFNRRANVASECWHWSDTGN